MKFEETPLAGVLIVRPDVFGDERGFFMETWNSQTFAAAGHNWQFVQDNHSRSTRGTLRGLHFQTEQPQGKLVRVASGKVFDVAVDLRRGSPSFGKWFGMEMSAADYAADCADGHAADHAASYADSHAADHAMLWIPPGCAHGFYTMSESADFLYKTTTHYHPASELCLRWDDPDVAVRWPIAEEPVLSRRDSAGLGWNEVPFFD